jgi:hypothetical protein
LAISWLIVGIVCLRILRRFGQSARQFCGLDSPAFSRGNARTRGFARVTRTQNEFAPSAENAGALIRSRRPQRG